MPSLRWDRGKLPVRTDVLDALFHIPAKQADSSGAMPLHLVLSPLYLAIGVFSVHWDIRVNHAGQILFAPPPQQPRYIVSVRFRSRALARDAMNAFARGAATALFRLSRTLPCTFSCLFCLCRVRPSLLCPHSRLVDPCSSVTWRCIGSTISPELWDRSSRYELYHVVYSVFVTLSIAFVAPHPWTPCRCVTQARINDPGRC